MYDINTKKYKKNMIIISIPIALCIIAMIAIICVFIYENNIDNERLMAIIESKNPSYVNEMIGYGVGLFCVAAFMTVFIILLNNTKKKIKQIEELNKIGKLIKGIPYRLVDSNVCINDEPLSQIEIKYTLSSGQELTLHGEPISIRKRVESIGKADLVIDENNPDNYYVDFEINRILGNTSADYYVNPNGEEDNITVQEEHHLDPKTEIKFLKSQGLGFIILGLIMLLTTVFSKTAREGGTGIYYSIVSCLFIIGGVFFLYKGRRVDKRIKDNQNENMESMIIEEGKQELQKAEESFNNAYLLVMALFVAAIAIYMDYSAYKIWNEGGRTLIIFSIFVWLIFVIIIFKGVRKRDK